MKLTIEQSILLGMADRAKSAVDSRASLPQLGCYLLSAKDNKLTLSGYNFNLVISISADCQCEDGSAAVNAARLREALAAFGKSELRIETDAAHSVTITSGKRRLRLPGINPEEYPPLPVFENPLGSLKLSGAEIQRCIGKVLPFASTETDARPAICGVAISQHEDRACFVATDGSRLRMEAVEFPPMPSSVLPSKAAGVLVSLCSDESATVDLSVSENMFSATSADWLTCGKLIEGAYSRWQQVVPDRKTPDIVFPRNAMLSELRLISAVGEELSGWTSVKLSGAAKSLAVTAGAKEAEAHSEVLGGSFNMRNPAAFQCAKLRDLVASFDAEIIEFSMADEMTPMVARSATGLAVMMPLRIS